MSGASDAAVVAVIGSSGFVGSAIADALRRRGVLVREVTSPRLTTSARDLPGLEDELSRAEGSGVVDSLREELRGSTAVVNAAGLAVATSDGSELFGANALLPGVVARAVGQDSRFLHVSSAAVQGRRPVLDESPEHEPFSPYSLTKALGERMVGDRGTIFRPTSVHGPGRPVTRSLSRLCSSPLASVAGDGERPTPQVLVGNVADAIAFVALYSGQVPPVVLQPSEGLTTAELVRRLGRREPRRVPERAAHGLVAGAYRAGTRSAGAAGIARRLEMLWFGQPQNPGWLQGKWKAREGASVWMELGR